MRGNGVGDSEHNSVLLSLTLFSLWHWLFSSVLSLACTGLNLNIIRSDPRHLNAFSQSVRNVWIERVRSSFCDAAFLNQWLLSACFITDPRLTDSDIISSQVPILSHFPLLLFCHIVGKSLAPRIRQSQPIQVPVSVISSLWLGTQPVFQLPSCDPILANSS